MLLDAILPLCRPLGGLLIAIVALSGCRTHTGASLRILPTGEKVRVISAVREDDGQWHVDYCTGVPAGFAALSQVWDEAEQLWETFEQEANASGATGAAVWPMECWKESNRDGWRPVVIQDTTVSIYCTANGNGSWKVENDIRNSGDCGEPP